MESILLTRELRDLGYHKDELRRLQRSGDLAHLRRGAWARPGGEDPTTPEEKHRQLTAAVVAQAQPGAAVSHVSAAALHGLPVWRNQLSQVHLTRSSGGRGKRRSDVNQHAASLSASDVLLLDGLAVTSLARTVADLARTLPFEQAVAAGDRALALGLDVGVLNEVLSMMERWPGVSQARRVANFIDGRSESVGESVSRVRAHEDGLPAPLLQHEIFDHAGELIGRVDFSWPKFRTIGEFDGMVKYGDLIELGRSPRDVLIAEKLREDALRDLGWRVVRWIWSELYQRHVVRDRVQRAFDASR